MGSRILLLGCSKRKNNSKSLLPAIDRYDGPAFRVLRKYLRLKRGDSPAVAVLSAKYGLLEGSALVPNYDEPLVAEREAELRRSVPLDFDRFCERHAADEVFVNAGQAYIDLVRPSLKKLSSSAHLTIAQGGVGGRASRLAAWLDARAHGRAKGRETSARATLLGVTVSMTHEQVLQRAVDALEGNDPGASRFETWYVPIGSVRVAPKWLVSMLTGLPVGRFRTADARRILSLRGVECKYADDH